jgi:hypothetical protein
MVDGMHDADAWVVRLVTVGCPMYSYARKQTPEIDQTAIMISFVVDHDATSFGPLENAALFHWNVSDGSAAFIEARFTEE